MSRKEIAAIVIPAAGASTQTKPPGPKSLLTLGEETVLGRQVRLLRKRFPRTPVYVCVGYEGSAVRGRFRSSGLHFVGCPDWSRTNVAATVRRGLEAAPDGPVLVLYGDLVFGERLVLRMAFPPANVLWGMSSSLRDEEVGLTVDEKGEVGHLSHGLPVQWAQLALLQPDARAEAASLCGEHPHWFFHEVLNRMLDRTPFRFQQAGDWLVEVDTQKDIEAARLAVRLGASLPADAEVAPCE